VGQSSPIFFAQRGRGCSLSISFPIFDLTIHSEDIRDQSRKLLEIAPNFGPIFALPNFRGWAFQKWYPHYHRCLAARCLEKFREDTPTSPEVTVTGAHTPQIFNLEN